jgi:tetratricopeptide (TPR) repeat protein
MQAKSVLSSAVMLLAGVFTGSALAQAALSLPTDRPGIVALQDLQQKQGKDMGKMYASTDPTVNLDALPDFIRQHPAASAMKNGTYNYAALVSNYIKKAHPESKTLDTKLNTVQDALKQAVAPYYVGMFDFAMARDILKDDYDPKVARTLAESGVTLYNRSDCLQDDRFEDESRALYDEKSAKHPVPFTYHPEDSDTHCAAEIASRYATLGRIQVKLGETEAATDSFQKALHEHSDMEAALGMATIDKAKDDKSAEMEMLTVAYLTGAMPSENILEAKALYVELHPGSTDADFDAVLDKRYAKTFTNPVKDLATPPEPAHPQHVVLEELFTGGDCEPCVAPDLASDAALHRYTRDQVVLAVYHDNAPGPDPFTTTTSENRAKFYGTGGSTPHIFLDGKELKIEEGQPSHAQSSFEILTKAADPLLAASSKATLNLEAHRKGNLVDVTVTGKLGDLPPKTHLQILLLETEVSYSGRNTLHFQPMVVHASAALKAPDSGFAVEHGPALSQSYTFDLKKIEADNLAYYDQYREGLEKRMAAFIAKGSFSKAEIDKMAAFREPKNLIHPDRLAVVAFLQADDSKQVLQTAYATVRTAPEGEVK